ncbi:MAG: acyl-ACP--UDP-N-acetylglucosamine O-acyltransferase [Proteobacteria bacterium]|nr:acyl-ACP--UDP-N-acetylglucosamine O-acyltransferase [Pseudomonadota bacterium]
MPMIHPTACVDAVAQIADDVTIGPYSVVDANVTILDGCRLGAHVHVTGHTRIGPRTNVFAFASLGTPPQSMHYRGGPTRLAIGSECIIRENVTINTGTEDDRGLTSLGDRCFLMAGSHVGHDCAVGNDVTFANNAVLGGHVFIGDNCFLGGNCAVHQHVRVGEGAMIGGLSGVRSDLIPFGYAVGQLAALAGINVVGLRRRGVPRADILRLRRALKALFGGAGNFADRLARARRDFAGDRMVVTILDFVAGGGRRALMHPARDRGMTTDE